MPTIVDENMTLAQNKIEIATKVLSSRFSFGIMIAADRVIADILNAAFIDCDGEFAQSSIKCLR